MDRKRLDVVLCALLLAGLTGFLLNAVAIRPPAHVYPLAVIGISLLLAGVACIRGVRALWRKGPARPLVAPGSGRIIALVMVALIAYGALVSVHYVVVTFLFLVGLYQLLAEQRTLTNLLVSIVVAAVVTAFIYFSFGSWLHVPLPGVS